MVDQILCIGQSDSCAGTGIQADIKTAQAFGGYAATAVTAVTVQNTQGVHDVHIIPTDIVRSQIEKVLEDLKPKVIKSGMLSNTATIDMFGDILDEIQDSDIKVVIDPVMTGRSSGSIMDKEARDALKRRLLIRGHVLTPNITEAQDLSGIKIEDVDSMVHAAETLRTLGAQTVILKGGSLVDDHIYDVLSDDDGTKVYQYNRMESRATHGAGTTLSAGIAMGLAQGLTPRDAFSRARAFVHKAIEHGEMIGNGFGPLNHRVSLDNLAAPLKESAA